MTGRGDPDSPITGLTPCFACDRWSLTAPPLLNFCRRLSCSAYSTPPRYPFSAIMKIKVLERSAAQTLPQRSGDPSPRSRNLDPSLHPFARAREYTRALTAAKMDRIYAKPFVAALEGHVDGVYTLAKDPGRLGVVGSGSGDGEIIVHHLPTRTQLRRIKAHEGIVSGLTFTRSRQILSCSVDRTIKLWEADGDSDPLEQEEADEETAGPSTRRRAGAGAGAGVPVRTFMGKMAFNSVDHHRSEAQFASASNVVQLWDETKTEPILNMRFGNGAETVLTVRFNQSETSVLGSTGTDRTMCLYDVRTGKAERRVVMALRANALSWHPTQPTVMLLASEDHNLYTFDVRNLASPTQIYKDHVAAVMACDWTPTGRGFVSGGWDRTVRLWREGEGRSWEVYHGKRMQSRVFATQYTADARFVLSGSDDGNVRVWKARASDKLGVVDGRERAAREYRAKLVEKWRHAPEVRKVERQRYLPKAIYSAGRLKREMERAGRGKEERRRAHTREGDRKPKAERRKVVLAEQE
ncbi:WD40 repeat-like protein [Calocera cornea HHB12733]|uniref:WD40 repeat-like protein n=1 Tax=Calocera cornea HHB12733 TaxID=1353952 RepID=A0A165C5T0_9BASI|nr:WD40 repeat-like protein [Calocera cornea HHB12733]